MFENIEPSLHPRKKSHLIMVMILLMYWIYFVHVLLRIFASRSSGIWSNFFLGDQCCLVLSSKYWWPYNRRLWVFLLILFWRVWEGLILIILKTFSRIYQWHHLVSDFALMGVQLLNMIYLFYFSFGCVASSVQHTGSL